MGWTITYNGPVVAIPNRFHSLWSELHSKENPDAEWFQNWLSRVPCGECQTNFRKYVAENPPDFDNFYRWSVDAHNFVNRKLNKPIWTGQS